MKLFDLHCDTLYECYETRAHDEALLAHGPCPIHRMTFLRKFYEKNPDAPR